MNNFRILFLLVIAISCRPRETADLVILNGKIITVDNNFNIAEAIAIRNDRIIAVGKDRDIEKLKSKGTRVIDAGGRAVIPGLIDGHAHPEAASVSELKDEIPDVHTVSELLNWIRSQADAKPKGEWIIFPKMFFTRLNELRPPTLEELDSVAPNHPVFLNGSYGGVVNSAAMKLSGIARQTSHDGIHKDSRTGLPIGIIKSSAFRLLKIPSSDPFSEDKQTEALQAMFKNYNRYGITSIFSGGGSIEQFEKYRNFAKEGKLTVRVFQNIRFPMAHGLTAADVEEKIARLKYKTGDGDEWVRIGALKVTVDGGILTGTAYLREPWGKIAEKVFGIKDPEYRGVLNYPFDELLPVAAGAAKAGWKFTAHCTGGGGVDLLLDIYEEVDKQIPVKDRRFSIIHANFFTPESIQRMSKLGVYADMQAAWFYKDAQAMKHILGEQRIKTFLPYRSLIDGGVIVNGGSDHMVKLDADKSINPYNPFLAMWSMITRTTEGGEKILPEEAVTREEALRMYTINNARASFEEDLKGSLEKGKLADLAILSNDIVDCPVDQIRNIKAEMTIVGGKIVHSTGKIN